MPYNRSGEMWSPADESLARACGEGSNVHEVITDIVIADGTYRGDARDSSVEG